METEIFRTHVTVESPSAEIGPKSSDSFSKPSRMHSKFKGGPIAQSKSLNIHFMFSFDRVGRDKSVGTGLTVKLGLVWQTEALECPKNSFTEIAILTN